ncbi:carbon storage regulator CsrA [Pseudalkalibacillus berkeleyi]|uniref:Translational regulator CsrA n=1 Tax=Pseudalkalibacillus berkeleyi TaxID=1069813 RepID=A0ABS9H4E3_9BACL|nr:carbon storage regulator CsrA [Pseudalkalibacillus berkeleyi]MCF6138753.1 carbon storage regulator CsrA [Pseudalkalibacillus berkeleyi]
MLVLTRKPNESIQIGEEIEIKVLGIDGDQIKIGIDAPKNIDIHRKEIYLSIQDENNQASQTPSNLMETLKSVKKSK